MTLYFLSGYPEVVGEDFLVIDGKEEYRFCGVTLQKRLRLYEPNPIPAGTCYTIGHNKHVMLFPTTISYLDNGQEIARVRHNWTNADRPNLLLFFKGWLKSYQDKAKDEMRRKSLWPKVMQHLRSPHLSNDENAKRIRLAMEEWETVSTQTLKRLIETMSESDLLRGKTEVLVSGIDWLVYYRYENRCILGRQKSVWGEVTLPSEEEEATSSSEWEDIRLAAPIANGWIIKTTTRDWLLQYKNGTIELQEIVCPVWTYQKLGLWTYWEAEGVALTPVGHMVALPKRTYLHGATSRWAISDVSSENRLVIISQEGAIYTITKEILTRYGKVRRLSTGNSGMLVAHERGKYCYLSMVPESNLPSLDYSWRKIIFPRHVADFLYIGVMRGDPDVFIVPFQCITRSGVGIFFINTRGDFWLCPAFFKLPVYGLTLYYKDRGNGEILIEFSSGQGTPITIMKARILRNFVQLGMGNDIVITGNMVSSPAKQGIFWDSLRPLIES